MARSPKIVNGRIRLSPALNRLTGYSGKARRYVDPATYAALATAQTAIEAAQAGIDTAAAAIEAAERTIREAVTISARAFEQARNLAEFGEPLTKEQRTRRLKRKPLEYRSAKARETARFQRRARDIRAIVHGISARDVKLIDRKRSNNPPWRDWSAEDKADFRDMFDEYDYDEILEALGSPDTK